MRILALLLLASGFLAAPAGAAAPYAPAITAAPDPGRERATLSLTLTVASDIEVRVVNAEGVYVGEVQRFAAEAGKVVLPISFEGLPDGAYDVEVRCTDGAGSSWEERHTFVIGA